MTEFDEQDTSGFSFEVELDVNEEQTKAALRPVESNVQVVAGPGTGKST